MSGQERKEVSIFEYSPKERRFSSGDRCLADCPSSDWIEDHNEWLTERTNATPSFEKIEELQSFNQTGAELTERLQEELPEMKVAPFQPIYDSLKVSACNWWHLKDDKYGFPFSVQKLPVSNDLKADFVVWRNRKDDNCLAQASTRCELEQQGQELQKRLHDELHQETAEEEAKESDFSQSCWLFGKSDDTKNDKVESL